MIGGNKTTQEEGILLEVMQENLLYEGWLSDLAYF